MKKILIILVVVPTFIYASYNPFFTTDRAPSTQKQSVQFVERAIPTAGGTNIQLVYFGFIETSKGKFALVDFNGKKIVVKNNDSLYLNEQIFQVNKIESNFMLIKDREGRVQTVYFSSGSQG